MVSVPDGLGGGLEKENSALSAGALSSQSFPAQAFQVPRPAEGGAPAPLAGWKARRKTGHAGGGLYLSLNQSHSFENTYA